MSLHHLIFLALAVAGVMLSNRKRRSCYVCWLVSNFACGHQLDTRPAHRGVTERDIPVPGGRGDRQVAGGEMVSRSQIEVGQKEQHE